MSTRQACCRALGFRTHRDSTAIVPRAFRRSCKARSTVLQGEIDTLFVLPADYLESGKVEQYRASDESEGGLTGQIWGTPAEWNFSGFLTAELIAGQVDANVLARALNSADYRNYSIGGDGAVSEAIPFAQELGEILVPTLFGTLLVIAVFMGSSTLLTSVAEEKETRMIEMLVTSASPLSIMCVRPASDLRPDTKWR